MNTGPKGAQGAYLGGQIASGSGNAPMMFDPSQYNPAPNPPLFQQQAQEQENHERPPTMGYQEQPQNQYQYWEGYNQQQYDQYQQYYQQQGGQGGYYPEYGQEQHQMYQQQFENHQPVTNGGSVSATVPQPDLVSEAPEQGEVNPQASTSGLGSRPPSRPAAQENNHLAVQNNQEQSSYYDYELQQWVNNITEADPQSGGQRFMSAGPDVIANNHEGEAPEDAESASVQEHPPIGKHSDLRKWFREILPD